MGKPGCLAHSHKATHPAWYTEVQDSSQISAVRQIDVYRGHCSGWPEAKHCDQPTCTARTVSPAPCSSLDVFIGKPRLIDQPGSKLNPTHASTCRKAIFPPLISKTGQSVTPSRALLLGQDRRWQILIQRGNSWGSALWPGFCWAEMDVCDPEAEIFSRDPSSAHDPLCEVSGGWVRTTISVQSLEEEDTEVTQSNWPSARWPVSPQWATGQFSSSVNNTPFWWKYWTGSGFLALTNPN